MAEALKALKGELKAWEADFRSREGREPTKEDIKANAGIAAKYKQYSNARSTKDLQSQKLGRSSSVNPPQQPTTTRPTSNPFTSNGQTSAPPPRPNTALESPTTPKRASAKVKAKEKESSVVMAVHTNPHSPSKASEGRAKVYVVADSPSKLRALAAAHTWGSPNKRTTGADSAAKGYTVISASPKSHNPFSRDFAPSPKNPSPSRLTERFLAEARDDQRRKASGSSPNASSLVAAEVAGPPKAKPVLFESDAPMLPPKLAKPEKLTQSKLSFFQPKQFEPKKEEQEDEFKGMDVDEAEGGKGQKKRPSAAGAKQNGKAKKARLSEEAPLGGRDKGQLQQVERDAAGAMIVQMDAEIQDLPGPVEEGAPKKKKGKRKQEKGKQEKVRIINKAQPAPAASERKAGEEAEEDDGELDEDGGEDLLLVVPRTGPVDTEMDDGSTEDGVRSSRDDRSVSVPPDLLQALSLRGGSPLKKTVLLRQKDTEQRVKELLQEPSVALEGRRKGGLEDLEDELEEEDEERESDEDWASDVDGWKDVGDGGFMDGWDDSVEV